MKYFGTIYVNGKHFTHSDFLTGFCDNSKSKVLKELQDVTDTFLNKDKDKISFHITDLQTNKTEIL